MINLYDKIKWALQRMFKGYDDRIYWGFNTYIADILRPSLRKFCERALADKEYMDLNPMRKEVYTEMLKRIQYVEDDVFLYIEDHRIDEMLTYFGEKSGYFWD